MHGRAEGANAMLDLFPETGPRFDIVPGDESEFIPLPE